MFSSQLVYMGVSTVQRTATLNIIACPLNVARLVRGAGRRPWVTAPSSQGRQQQSRSSRSHGILVAAAPPPGSSLVQSLLQTHWCCSEVAQRGPRAHTA